MTSQGRRTAAYLAARREAQTGNYPCSLATGPWCTRIGTTVDHDPPLSTAPHPSQWHGTYRPACKPCQDRQGAAIRNGTAPTEPWQW